MKTLLPALTLTLTAAVCLAANDAVRPADDLDSDASSGRSAAASTSSTSPTSASGASLKAKDGAEVVSKSATSLTVKVNGKEIDVPVQGKAATALRVVNPGDKVRLYYVNADADGRPTALSGFVITEPSHDSARAANRTDKSDRSDDERKDASPDAGRDTNNDSRAR